MCYITAILHGGRKNGHSAHYFSLPITRQLCLRGWYITHFYFSTSHE